MSLRVLENQFLYHPEKPYFETPEDYKWPYEDVWLKTDDGVQLHAWWIGSKKYKRTVLLFHGNAGNISHRLHRISFYGKIPIRFFLLDYRGYGQSQGRPSEKGLYQDAKAAYLYLRNQELASKDIVLFGESLGGAVGIELAANESVDRILIESTFTSLREMGKLVMPFIPSPLVSNSFNSLENIKKTRAPILIVHGSRDSLVPVEMGRRLFEAANHPKEFFEVQGAEHNDMYMVGGEAYREKVVSKFNRVFKRAHNCVVSEQIGQCFRLGNVVYSYKLNVFSIQANSVDRSSNSTKSIYGHANAHELFLSLFGSLFLSNAANFSISSTTR